MAQRDHIGRLVAAASGLEPGQLKLLLEIAEAMRRPIRQEVRPDSDICVAEFTANFSNRLVVHHTANEEKFKKKSFEFAFVAASAAGGKTGRINTNATFPGADVTVDGTNYSLKTEASAGIDEATITISKLMEARWIRECRTGDDFAAGVQQHVVGHLRGYERILMLRAFDVSGGVRYDLIEIPLDVLLAAQHLTGADFAARTANGSSSATVRHNGNYAYRLRLDGSVEKVTVSGLAVSLCTIHARWQIPTL
jgi:hypothetical protein